MGLWGACPLSQHSGGGGRHFSEFKAMLIFKVSFRTAQTSERNLVSKKKNYPGAGEIKLRG